MMLKKGLMAITTICVLALVVTRFDVGVTKSFANERYKDLEMFTKVLNLIQQYYVEEVDTPKLIRGAIKGMLKELDPHTNYLSYDIYKEFEDETSGKFGGIGIEITIQKGVLTVISPIEDTPAWKAGIQAGDKIVSINGESTKGFSLAEAATHMRGKKGSAVKLGIYRDGLDAPKIIKVVRGDVKIKSVKYTDLGDGYMYIRLTSFIDTSFRDIEKAISKHEKKNKSVSGILLDLRQNPGGLLDQAVKISDLFLEKGPIVSTVGRDKKDKEVIYAKKAKTLENFPIVILINEYSASASEILAGALQDNKRALIVGKRSFGKGSVQSVVKLGEKRGGLKLTVARYFTPSGRSIQAEGVMPDVEIDNFDSDTLNKAMKKRKIKREKDIKGHLLSKSEKEKLKKQATQFKLWWLDSENADDKKLSKKERLLKKDFQIFQAYNYLKAWKVMKAL